MTSIAVKNATLDYLFKSFTHFGWLIEDWVLPDNHYHLIAEAHERATTLPSVINNFHKFSALWIKKNSLQPIPDQKIWCNYWDTCITHENSYFARLNYIWFNPVKHGYVERLEEWVHGSYFHRFKNQEPVEYIMQSFPCDRVNFQDDY